MVAATEKDWSGFYGGLSYSATSGAVTENTGGLLTPDLKPSSAAGLFLGYNMQRGNFVYGGELDYTAFDNTVDGFPTASVEDFVELRVRGGYAISDALLLYGFVGYASGSFEDTSAPSKSDLSGTSYGMGADYLFSDHMFAGLEVSRRDVSGKIPGGGTLGFDADAVSLRIGYKF